MVRIGSTQTPQPVNSQGIPHRFVDVASGELMVDPVILPNGLTMSRSTAMSMLRPPALQGRTNTSAPLFTEAPELQSEIEAFLQERPELAPQLSVKELDVVGILQAYGLSPQRARTLVTQTEPSIFEAKEVHELATDFLAQHQPNVATAQPRPTPRQNAVSRMMPARLPAQRR